MATLTPFKNTSTLSSTASNASQPTAPVSSSAGDTQTDMDIGRLMRVRDFERRPQTRVPSPLFRRAERIEAQFERGEFASGQRSHVERLTSDAAFSHALQLSVQSTSNARRMFESNHTASMEKVGSHGTVQSLSQVDGASIAINQALVTARSAAHHRPILAYATDEAEMRRLME